MKVLLTGATGFVGRHVLTFLKESRYTIVATYCNTLPQDTIKVQYSRIDLSDIIRVKELLREQKFDAIIHLAMQMRGKQVVDYLKNSILATQYLISEAEKTGVQTFILASSIAVYGYVEGMVNESSDRVSLDDYATSKYLCERMLEDSKIKDRLAIRLPRMLGSGMDLSYPWIPALIGRLIKGDEVSFFNPDLPYNNMAYVSTLTDFLKLQLETGNEGYRICTLGASEPLTVIEVIEHLKRGLSSSSILKERIDNLPRNTCHLIDIKRACEMGYKPMPVNETLNLIIRDMRREYRIGE